MLDSAEEQDRMRSRERAAERRELRTTVRERIADDREAEADERERVADERETQADERERVADEREARADERERLGEAAEAPTRSLSSAMEELDRETPRRARAEGNAQRDQAEIDRAWERTQRRRRFSPPHQR